MYARPVLFQPGFLLSWCYTGQPHLSYYGKTAAYPEALKDIGIHGIALPHQDIRNKKSQ